MPAIRSLRSFALALLATISSPILPSPLSSATTIPVLSDAPSAPTPEAPPSRWNILSSFNPFRRPSSRPQLNNKIWDSEQLLDQLRMYQDNMVLRFNVSTKEDESSLRRGIDRMLIDVWDFTENYVDVRIESPYRLKKFLSLLPEPLKSSHAILIRNLPSAIAASYPSSTPKIDAELQHALHNRGTTEAFSIRPKLKSAGVTDLFFQDYQPLAVISTWMRLLESMFRGRGLVRMVSIGKSYEGRDIPGLRVGKKNPASSHRHAILVTGGIHAREWISTSTVNYVAWSFITGVDNDPMISRILDSFDIIFVPVMNPDGYDYTWEVDRLWRKTRQPTSLSICPGYDLDHAFGFRWEEVEHEDEECSQSFGGHGPFEAVEARQLAEWAQREKEQGTRFVGFLDLHSYSQQVLVPYEYTCDVQPPNFENLEEVAFNMAKHMRLTNGELYTVTSACDGAVPNEQVPRSSPLKSEQRARMENRGGSMMDYVFHEIGAHYSYQIKLRDTGSYGFLLPSDNIVPTGEELLQAMKYFGDFLLGNNGHEFAAGDEGGAQSSNDAQSNSELR